MSFSPLRDYFLTVEIEDISTASQSYIPVPAGGKVIKIFSAINGAIATADADLTAKIGGTAITGGLIVVAFTSSAAGDVDSVTPSALNDVKEGDALEIETDGASTNTVKAFVTFQIRK